MIVCYNELEGEPLTWQAAIDLHAYIPGQESSGSGSVSCEVKREAIGHLRLHERAREEIQQLEGIQQKLTSLHSLNRLNAGSINLVKQQLFCDRKRLLLDLQRAFSIWVTDDDLTTDPNLSPLPFFP